MANVKASPLFVLKAFLILFSCYDTNTKDKPENHKSTCMTKVGARTFYLGLSFDKKKYNDKPLSTQKIYCLILDMFKNIK